MHFKYRCGTAAGIGERTPLRQMNKKGTQSLSRPSNPSESQAENETSCHGEDGDIVHRSKPSLETPLRVPNDCSQSISPFPP